MLRSLLYRDFILNRAQLLIVLGIFAGFQVYFVLRADSPRMWLLFSAVFLAFQTFVPFSREDKFRSGGWVCTLPVSRRQIVRARWIGAWALMLGGFLVAGALALALPGSRVALGDALTPDTVLLAATVVSLLLLALMPFTIRYGLKGILIFLVVAQLAGAALLAAATLIGSRGGGAGPFLHRAIGAARAALLSWQAALTPALFHVAVLAAVVLLNWLGYRLALALYRRREF